MQSNTSVLEAMAKQYHSVVTMRMTDNDLLKSEEISQKLRTPVSTLIRSVWCQWLETQTSNPNVATENR